MKLNYLLLALVLILSVGVCSAVPTTDAVTDITTRGATFNAHGGASTCWYVWGGSSTNFIYKTANTSCGSSHKQSGAPILTSTKYYVKSCDGTGCGSSVEFTTPAATISNLTHYGEAVAVMFAGGMNITEMADMVTIPYRDTIYLTSMWGLLFGFIFIGMWLRQKDIVIPMMLAMISGGAIWLGGGSLGIPPAFEAMGQALLIVGFGGLLLSWFTR
jgi:hypothetical protein